MQSKTLLRALTVYTAVAAIGCVLLVVLNRDLRSELDARPVIKETRVVAPSAVALTDNAPPATELPLPVEPPSEPPVRSVQTHAADVRQPLLEALMLVDPVEQWRALRPLGIEPRTDDFRRALGSLSDNWPDLNKVRNLVSQWAALDPKAAAAWVMELGASGRQHQALQALVQAWGKEDAAGVRQWVASLPPTPLRDQAAAQVVQVLAATDPAGAAEVAHSIQNPSIQSGAIQQVATHWTRKDSEAVQGWLQRLPEGPERDAAAVAVARTISSKAPAEAAALLAVVKDDNLRQQVAPMIMTHWTRQDPTAAAQWLSKLPAGHWRDSAIQQFVSQVPDAQSAMALEWAQTIQNEHVRRSAVANAVAKLGRQDPAAASEWLNRMQPGVARDQAVQQFALNVQKTYPADAVQWAMSIEDVSLRQQTVETALVTWLRADRASAEYWLRSAPLEEHVKQEILKKAGK